MASGAVPTFSGGSFGSSAEDYLEHIEASVLASGHLAEASLAILRKSGFKTGLRGRAKEWYRSLPDATCRSWDILQAEFRKKFEGRNSARRDGLFDRVANFQAEQGESIKDYVRRARRLGERADDDLLFRRQLLTRFVGGLPDEGLKTRLEDHLALKPVNAGNGKAEMMWTDDDGPSEHLTMPHVVAVLRRMGKGRSAANLYVSDDEDQDEERQGCD